ncbi:MAG TPA: ligase-associated DNA damage response endonuclease PdeM [Caulobacteraceae bacterium]
MTSWARRGDGGLRIRIADTEVVARPSGALWVEGEGALIVADLHFEKGSAFAARGQLLPPYDTGETLTRLEAEVEALGPSLIIFLGDALHDVGAEERLCAADAGRISALAFRRTLVWIAGNHDPAGPRRLPGEIVATLALNGLRLVHEPTTRPAVGEVAGHLHPCAKIAGAGGRRRCFVTDGERLLLPAFGAYAGGLNVRDPAIRSLMGETKLAVVLGQGRVHPIPWRALRPD